MVGTGEEGQRLVRKHEQRLFGGVHEGAGVESGPAAFRIRLVREDVRDRKDYTAGRDNPLKYLGFGFSSTREELARLGIAPGSRFTLEIVSSERTRDILMLVNYVWVNCGGLGARWRHGWGCLAWNDATLNPAPQAGFLLGQRREELARLLGVDPGGAHFDQAHPPEFPVIAKNWFRVKLCSGFMSWEQAMEAVRNQLHVDSNPPRECLGAAGYGYRQGDGESHEWVVERTSRGNFPYYPSRDKRAAIEALEARSGSASSPAYEFKNALFGLPIQYRVGGRPVTITPYSGRDELRRPCPISFRIFEHQKGFYVATVYTKSRFLPEGAKLAGVRGRGDRVFVRYPDTWDYLDRFFQSCDGNEVEF